MSAQPAQPAADGATPDDIRDEPAARVPEEPADHAPADRAAADQTAAPEHSAADHAPADHVAADQTAERGPLDAFYAEHAETEPVEAEASPALALNRPARWAVAGVEVLLAVGLVLLAAWAWRHASAPYELPAFENKAIPKTVDTLSGPWTALAVGCGMAAALLVVDAAREAVLAQRARGRR